MGKSNISCVVRFVGGARVGVCTAGGNNCSFLTGLEGRLLINCFFEVIIFPVKKKQNCLLINMFA